jgi:hypothetical protein
LARKYVDMAYNFTKREPWNILHTAIIWHLNHHPFPVLMQNCDGHKFKEVGYN